MKRWAPVMALVGLLSLLIVPAVAQKSRPGGMSGPNDEQMKQMTKVMPEMQEQMKGMQEQMKGMQEQMKGMQGMDPMQGPMGSMMGMMGHMRGMMEQHREQMMKECPGVPAPKQGG